MAIQYLYAIDPDIVRELNTLLTAEILATIYDLAQHSYPEECCGLVLQQGIRPCQNEQNYWHQLDPINYPRNATQGFIFSAADTLFLSKSIKSDNPAQIIYHSHPNVGAYFSAEDKKNAVVDGAPIYPVDHLVIDVQKAGVLCSKLFRFCAGDYRLMAVLAGNNIPPKWPGVFDGDF
jgi:proteasome lid subunit RPN8/RPN11